MIKTTIMGYRSGPQPSATLMVEKELINLGCEIVDNEPELLIELCGLYENAENFYNKCTIKPIRLYNLLDVNNTDPNFYNKAMVDYENCEIATTISNTVKEEIKQKFKTEKDIKVIGFPIRPVKFEKISCRGVPFLFVGRYCDPNKRTYLIPHVIRGLDLDIDNTLTVAGPEKPPFDCSYSGVVDDEILNLLYNAAEFTFLLSHKEGLGLPAIESVICGSIPVLCKDNKLVYELGLPDFAADPNPESIIKLIKKIGGNVEYYWKKMDELRPVFQHQFSAKTVAKNILDLYHSYKAGK